MARPATINGTPQSRYRAGRMRVLAREARRRTSVRQQSAEATRFKTRRGRRHHELRVRVKPDSRPPRRQDRADGHRARSITIVDLRATPSRAARGRAEAHSGLHTGIQQIQLASQRQRRARRVDAADPRFVELERGHETRHRDTAHAAIELPTIGRWQGRQAAARVQTSIRNRRAVEDPSRRRRPPRSRRTPDAVKEA